jgi:hypothetical protein
MYVDQILNRELDTVFSWNFIQLLNNASRGPKPLWYKKLIGSMASKTGNLKSHWLNLPWQPQNLRFISQRQEVDGRKVNWYVIVDKENPELFTWVKEKGNISELKRDRQLPLNQQHYALRQNPKTGHAILEECSFCTK